MEDLACKSKGFLIVCWLAGFMLTLRGKSRPINNMTKEEVIKLVAMYLVAIGPSGSPSSYVWMAIDKNMEDVYRHNLIIGNLERQGILTNKNHFLKLTEKGLAMLTRLLT